MDSLQVWFAAKNRVEVRREQFPDVPGPGQVLLRCNKTLISTGTELTCLERNFEEGTNWADWVKYPFAPGYSWAGEVIAVGEGVEGFSPGDRIALRHGHRQHALMDAGSLEARALRIPDGVSDEEAVWFGISKIVQNGIRRAEIELGDSVVIIGLGILGQLAVQYAYLCGARDVIAIDPAEKRTEVASEHGATHALAMPVAEAKGEVYRITGGRGADVVLDVTGVASVFAAALGFCRKFGRFVILGDTGMPSRQHLTGEVMSAGITITAAHDGHPPARGTVHVRWGGAEMNELFFDLLLQKRMKVRDLITHRYPAAEAAAAYEMLRRDRSAALGVLFDFTGGSGG